MSELKKTAEMAVVVEVEIASVLVHIRLEAKPAVVEVLRVIHRCVVVLGAEDRIHVLVHALLVPDPVRNCAIEITTQSLATLSRMDFGKKWGEVLWYCLWFIHFGLLSNL